MTPKLSFPQGVPGLHITRGSLGPPKSTTQMESRSNQMFLHGSLLCPTDRHTDHAASVVRLHLNCTPCMRCGLKITNAQSIIPQCKYSQTCSYSLHAMPRIHCSVSRSKVESSVHSFSTSVKSKCTGSPVTEIHTKCCHFTQQATKKLP